jgi:DNA polymerase III epsilon subunit-like protein
VEVGGYQLVGQRSDEIVVDDRHAFDGPREPNLQVKPTLGVEKNEAVMADFIVVDLEATCWEKGTRPDRMETIEIGAVRVGGTKWLPGKEFSRFVRPTADPVLSEFCRSLTGIKQADVNDAEPFPSVFHDFLVWCGGGDSVLAKGLEVLADWNLYRK